MNKIFRYFFLPLIILVGMLSSAAGQSNHYYYQYESPDAVVYLPAPPDKDDVAFLDDEIQWEWGKTLRNTDRGKIAMTHIRYINPLPKNTAELLSRFKTVIVAELNTGQMASYLQSKVPNLNICHINKVQGQPFLVQEIVDGVKNIMMEEEL